MDNERFAGLILMGLVFALLATIFIKILTRNNKFDSEEWFHFMMKQQEKKECCDQICAQELQDQIDAEEQGCCNTG